MIALDRSPMPPRPQGRLADHEVARIRAAHAGGASARVIARQLECSVRTVYRYLEADRYRCRHCPATFPTSALAFSHLFGDDA